ncbi:MAG: hypothetical protein A3K23_06680 [Desulfobacca sp. RBG_16_58_9]|nr:MAG: hypothetical protein A3K23_06680 [Desulfobacca sp. RBG_16_58_9]
MLGEKDAGEFLDSLGDTRQLPLGFELTRNGFLKFPPRVELVDITPQIIDLLSSEPEILWEASPEFFENLICNRLEVIGYGIERVGSSIFNKDGGIDILAWSQAPFVPCLMAVQVKHTALRNRKIGSPPVRDLLGAVQTHGFNAGLLVTNTTFTADARWVAEQRPFLIQLRDFEDLRRWLRNDFLSEHEWRYLPKQIELCPGVIIKLPY